MQYDAYDSFFASRGTFYAVKLRANSGPGFYAVEGLNYFPPNPAPPDQSLDNEGETDPSAAAEEARMEEWLSNFDQAKDEYTPLVAVENTAAPVAPSEDLSMMGSTGLEYYDENTPKQMTQR